MELLSPGTMLAALTDAPPQASLFHTSAAENFLHPTPAFLVVLVLLQVITILGTWLTAKLVVDEEESTFINALKVWFWSLVVGVVVNIGMYIGHSMVPALSDPMRLALIQWGGIALMILLTLLVRMKIYVVGILRALIILLLPGIVMALVVVVLLFTVFKAAVTGQGLASMPASVEKFWKAPAPDPTVPADGTPPSSDLPTTAEIDQLLNTALHPTGPTPPLSTRVALVQTLQQKLQSRRNSLATNDAHEVAVWQNQLNRYLSFRDIVIAEQLGGKTAGSGTPASHAPVH